MVLHEIYCFNAARGFVGGAASHEEQELAALEEFQCRTRLCGWCSGELRLECRQLRRFNAARGFVGGAASSLSALFPLGGKSTFGKSPEIREF